jgi:hypothetical protein
MRTPLNLLTSAFLFLSLAGLAQTQKHDTTIFIGGFQTSRFYAGEFNALGVYSPNYDIKSLVFKVSQGKLENIDAVQNGFLSLTRLKPGNVAISVFKHDDTGLLLLNKRLFKVIKRQLTQEEKKISTLSSKPRLSIAGFTDSIPCAVIRSATKIDINEPFKIQSLTFMIYTRREVYDGTAALTLQSGEFDENLKHVLTRIKTGDELGITLDNIRVIDFRGKVYALKAVHFKVID